MNSISNINPIPNTSEKIMENTEMFFAILQGKWDNVVASYDRDILSTGKKVGKEKKKDYLNAAVKSK